MFDFAFNAQRFAVYLIPTLLGIIMHEVAHGWMASRKGDQTARFMGRLTLNPVSHFDALGAAVFLLTSLGTGFIFGWAKPVPIDFRKLKYHRKGIILVSAAGIIMNIWVAVISALFILLIQFIPHPYTQMILHMFFLNMAAFNIIIALFNALPIPPLDGSKILFGWSREPWAVKYVNSGKAGLAAIVFLIFIMPEIGRALGLDLNLFRTYLIGTTRYLLSLLV